LSGYGLTIFEIEYPLVQWSHWALSGIFALLFVIHTCTSVILIRYRWREHVRRLVTGVINSQDALRMAHRVSGWVIAVLGGLMLLSGLDWFKIGTGRFLQFTAHVRYDVILSSAIITHTAIGSHFALRRRRAMRGNEAVAVFSLARRQTIALIGGAIIALVAMLYLDRIPRVRDGVERVRNVLPPGQYEVGRLHPLTYGTVPTFDENSWTLNIHGLVTTPMMLTYDAVRSLPRTVSVSDFHCVTGWTKFGNRWEGVSLRTIMEMVQPKDNAQYVLIVCEATVPGTAQGDTASRPSEPYTTSLPLSDVDRDDVLLAFLLDDQELPDRHGSPLRLVVPHKYGYKSAKWVREIRFSDRDALGFWESRGYSNSANPLTGDRHATPPVPEPE
jgi:DMSO/TMAO reductase YedYZ molybdopterin-dependent catalytic subunit